MDAKTPFTSAPAVTSGASEIPVAGGWRNPRGEPSLSGMFASVRVAKSGSFWRKLAAFLGPGYLVATGYMDPGNWATSLAGGSKFGYALLTVALMSNIMAIILQALCARLGVGAGRDLAQACRDAFPKRAGRGRSGCWLKSRLLQPISLKSSAPPSASICCSAFRSRSVSSSPRSTSFSFSALQAVGFRWVEAFIVGHAHHHLRRALPFRSPWPIRTGAR